jgi:hypothetical protein
MSSQVGEIRNQRRSMSHPTFAEFETWQFTAAQ